MRKPLVILTFPDTQSLETLERIKAEMDKYRPDVDFLLVDSCSGAVVVDVPGVGGEVDFYPRVSVD